MKDIDKRKKKWLSVENRDLWDVSPEWTIIREINIERKRNESQRGFRRQKSVKMVSHIS